MELTGHIDHAIAAAFAAGREILAVYGTDFTAEQKADKSPLTEADKRAHRAIVRELEPTGLPVLSEEGREMGMDERQPWGSFWLVDPLDGTKEFIKRNGEFTVNIALMERDGQPQGPLGSARPIAGVLYAPVKDQLFFAWQGGGAYRQNAATSKGGSAYERALSAERLPVPHALEAFTIVASRSHQSPESEGYIALMEQEHGRVSVTFMGIAL